MTAVLVVLLTIFVALCGPNHTTVYVVPSQIVAVLKHLPHAGEGPTKIITGNGSLLVCETPEEVLQKIYDREGGK